MEAMSIERTETNNNTRLDPKLFALWIAMCSIVMMFGAFTSAYMVKQAAGNWLDFSPPSIFYISTAAIVLSSVTIHLSYNGYVKGNEKAYKGFLVATAVLGVLFVILQVLGWNQLFANGVDLKGNVSGSFFYLITAAHAAHVIGGIVALVVALIYAFALKYKITTRRKNRFRLVAHYWHFVDALWIYLLLFLILFK